MARLQLGQGMDKPAACPQYFFDSILEPCTRAEPHERLSFATVLKRLTAIAAYSAAHPEEHVALAAGALDSSAGTTTMSSRATTGPAGGGMLAALKRGLDRVPLQANRLCIPQQSQILYLQTSNAAENSVDSADITSI